VALAAMAILVTGPPVRAQQKPVFSQYMFNPLAINPAFAGTQQNLSVAALYRDQWINLEGAPNTMTFTANTAVPKKNIGLGMTVYRDQIGVHSDLGVFLAYSYQLRFKKNKMLSMGLQGGFSNLKSDFSALRLKDPNDPHLTGIISKVDPNFGMGLFFQDKQWYAGFSIPYIINTKFFQDQDIISDARAKRYYFLAVGRLIDINRRLQFKPELLIRVQEGAPVGADINGKLIIDRKVAFGASYRSGDAIIGTFEFEMNDNFRLGYAYEYSLSKLQEFTQGTHEIMINYRANPIGGKKSKFCPTYF
jgi:type IX secretion system PorP/SprF family membrane protein